MNTNVISNHSNVQVNDDEDDHAMDFIENDLTPCDGELFNLDTFDMLSEFSNLDDFTAPSNTQCNTFYFMMKSTSSQSDNDDKDVLNGNMSGANECDGKVNTRATVTAINSSTCNTGSIECTRRQNIQSTQVNSMIHPLALGEADNVNNNQERLSRGDETESNDGLHNETQQLLNKQQDQHTREDEQCLQQQVHRQQSMSQSNCPRDSNSMHTSCHESMAQSSDFILPSNSSKRMHLFASLRHFLFLPFFSSLFSSTFSPPSLFFYPLFYSTDASIQLSDHFFTLSLLYLVSPPPFIISQVFLSLSFVFALLSAATVFLPSTLTSGCIFNSLMIPSSCFLSVRR